MTRALLLALALLALASLTAGSEGVWPTPPDLQAPPLGKESSLRELPSDGLSAADDFRYAAGLYRALENSLLASNPTGSKLSSRSAAKLLRAILSQGRGGQIRQHLAKRKDLPADLELLMRLDSGEPDWSDLEAVRWRKQLAGIDGESLYWQAHLELSLGKPEAARRCLKQLLRREQGSVFAPVALELLEGIPVPEALPPLQTGAQPTTAGVRVQWGVFRDPLRARRQREAVEAYGQAAEILPFRRNGVDLYRVCSPPFSLDESAREAGDLLEARYGLAYVIHRPDATP